MVEPHRPLDGPVADALVASDHHQTLHTDDGQPLVVEAAPRDLRQVGTGENDVSVQISECLTERQVVLVDAEPGRNVRLGRLRTRLLLVGDCGPYVFGRHLVAIGDLIDRLAGVKQLPQPLSRHPLCRGTAEADERIDDNRRCHPRRAQQPDVAFARRVELDLLEEPLGVVRQEDLLAGPDHDGDRRRDAVLLLQVEDQLLAEDVRLGRGDRVGSGELAPQLVDDRAEALEGHALSPVPPQVPEFDELAPGDDVLTGRLDPDHRLSAPRS